MHNPDGLHEIELRARDGAQASIFSHGAHVTSWIPAGGVERLFLSSLSEYRRGAAIRGGVPVIFPQFAAEGPLPKHGFARTSEWQLLDVTNTPSGAKTAQFKLRDTPETQAIWPCAFAAEFEVTVGAATLTLSLQVENTGVSAFEFTAALHTYLRVLDVRNVVIPGLRGVSYRDSAAGNRICVEQEPDVTIRGEVDRIYYDAPPEIRVIEKERIMLVRSQGFVDTVIWNPGAERGAALKDMEPEGYLRMLCIESAAIGKPIHLEPEQRWSAVQILSAG